jgi:hypothetical protein
MFPIQSDLEGAGCSVHVDRVMIWVDATGRSFDAAGDI